jgi:hypothetical protein
MTKKEAESYFRDYILSGIRQQEGSYPDYPMRTTEWHNFTDRLCKNSYITVQQYDKWDCPRYCYSPSEWKEKRERKLRLVSRIMTS